MKRNRTIIPILVIAICLSASFTFADDGFMISRSWKIHERGVTELLENWRTNKPDSAYGKALEEILNAETNLNHYGITANNDKRLICRFFENKNKRVTLQSFAAKVFLHKFEQAANWSPNLSTILKKKEYNITPNAQYKNDEKNTASFSFSD